MSKFHLFGQIYPTHLNEVLDNTAASLWSKSTYYIYTWLPGALSCSIDKYILDGMKIQR